MERRALGRVPIGETYFRIPELPGLAGFELELREGLLFDPVVPELDPLAFIASKTDMPRGPIVITTGSPSGDLPCTTNDSATTLTSVNPSFCRSCWIFCAATRPCWDDWALCWFCGLCWVDELCGDCASAGPATKANVAAARSIFMGISFVGRSR